MSNPLPAQTLGRSVIARMAERFGVDATKMVDTLKATAFQTEKPITNEQLMALCVVADQYKLNPFTKEIYAYPEKKGDGIVPVVGVDGWVRIINEHPQFNGVDFRYSDEIIESAEHKPCNEWIESVFYRKDRAHPIVVREYLEECYQPPRGQYKTPGPWQSHTRRMLRHKTLIQGGRIAFGFAGIYDPDEAERIVEGEVVGSAYNEKKTKPQTRAPRQISSGNPDPVTIDHSEPEPEVAVISVQELNELALRCVKAHISPADLAKQLKVDSLAELPITDLARAGDVIDMMATAE